MECRSDCGACCIAPSITSPLPGMPGGKPAGVRCAQLTEANSCLLYGRPDRPRFCQTLKPSPEMCGGDAAQALRLLEQLEISTCPEKRP